MRKQRKAKDLFSRKPSGMCSYAASKAETKLWPQEQWLSSSLQCSASTSAAWRMLKLAWKIFVCLFKLRGFGLFFITVAARGIGTVSPAAPLWEWSLCWNPKSSHHAASTPTHLCGLQSPTEGPPGSVQGCQHSPGASLGSWWQDEDTLEKWLWCLQKTMSSSLEAKVAV